METTKVFTKLAEAYVDPSVRIIVSRGSTRSSKTWSALQLLNYIAERSTRPRVISCVSESLPHLKRGAIRDFETMMRNDGAFNDTAWNATDKVYKYGRGALEFFGVDSAGKVHGSQRDVLFVNEAIHIDYEIYRQLAIRTSEKIILDYNPEFESWIEEKVLSRPDARLIHSTYLDNDMLSASQVAEIESNRDIDPDWWQVYGLGLIGSRQGLVLNNWDIVESMPNSYDAQYIGIDFGFTAPAAIVHVRVLNGEAYIKEIAYETGLTNPQLADIIKHEGFAKMRIVADSAEPKSIKELQNEGLDVVGADKGDESVRLGVQVMNRTKKHYTKDSVNCIAENRKYRYKKDAFGNYSGDIIRRNDHSIDATRYVFLKYLSNISGGFDYHVSG